MCSSFVFLILIVVTSVVSSSKYSNLRCTKTCDDSRVIEAIKNLETKMENLIALVNKTSTPQPTPSGILTKRNVQMESSFNLCILCCDSSLSFIVFAGVFASSCKEQYEKYK